MTDKAVPPATPASPARHLYNPMLHAVLIVLLGVAAYANTFQAPFVFDDYQSLLELPYVQDLRYLIDWSLAPEHAAEHNFRMRFVGNLSFALNYALHGTEVAGYHMVNLAIHLANALLVYFLVRLTFRTPFFGGRDEEQGARSEISYFLEPRTSNLEPLLAALLFVAHPVQTQAVTYIVQRLTSLTTFFCLACIVLYIKARENFAQKDGVVRGVCWYGASLGCALLAMKTKEIAFTLPLAVCLYEFMFLQGERKRRLIYLFPLLLTMLVIPLSLLGAPGAAGEAVGRVGEVTRVDSDLTRWEYLFTELRVIVTYLRLLALPVNQNLLYDYPVYRTFFTQPVFFSFLLLAALLALALYLRFSSRLTPRASRLVSFGILWFFLTLSVESSLIPIMDVIFEHRLYLPSVGAFIAIAALLGIAGQKLGERVRRGETMIISLAGLIVLALAGATYSRNEVWRSQESLWQDVVNKSPAKAAGHQNLGIALFQKGEIDRAFASFDRAIAIDPEFAEALCNRGNLYARAGQPERAIRDYESALAVDPEFVEAWNNLGLVWSELGDQDRAIPYLARAIALKPGYVKSHNNMGLALTRKGRPREAIPYLDKALSLNRNYGLAWFNRGVAWKETGRIDRAIADLTRAIELEPRLAAAYSHRGEALAQSGARDRAIGDFRKACENNDENGCRQLRALTGR